jgi:hypothetical protein
VLLAPPFQRNHPRLKKAGKAAVWLVILALMLTGMSFLSFQRPTPPLPVKDRPYLGTIPELGVKVTSLNFYDADNSAIRQRFVKNLTTVVAWEFRYDFADGYPTKHFNVTCIL